MDLTESLGVSRIRRLFKVADPCGLHLRPAAIIAKAVSAFDADVFIRHGTRKVNGKSLLSLLTLCAGPGDVLDVVAEGADAVQSMETLAGVGQEQAFLVNCTLTGICAQASGSLPGMAAGLP